MEVDNLQLHEKVAYFEIQDNEKDVLVKKLETKLKAKKEEN